MIGWPEGFLVIGVDVCAGILSIIRMPKKGAA